MTTLAVALDRPQDLVLSLDRAHDAAESPLDLSVVTIESLVARDISAYSERNRRSPARTLVRAG